jgi:peptidyl-prolyl cis-trans isomerase B (cyclophilin B)
MQAKINTKKGVMTIEFYEADAPKTVSNFVKLAKEGYYDGTGGGGPGYTIDCELSGENQYHDRGVLSMAHAGRNTGGSQFFICHSRNNTSHLDGNHTCFAKVIDGLEVIDAIQEGDRIESIVADGGQNG